MEMKILIAISFLTSFGIHAETADDRLKNAQAEEIELRNTATKKGQASLTETATPNATCDAFKATKKAEAEALTMNTNNELRDGDMGSPLMRECVTLSKGTMRYLYKNGSATGQGKWKEFLETSNECMNDPKVCDPDTLKNCVEKLKPKAARCDAAAYLISTFQRDWTSADDVKTETVKGGNPQITCQGSGIETLDYVGCVKFVQNGDVMDVAQAAVQTGQELYYKDKTMSAQAEVAQNPNTATAALEALKTGVKSQQDMMTQRAALDAGKLAALASYYSDIPDNSVLMERCQKYNSNPPDFFKENNKGCSSAVNQPGFALLMNQQSKEKMKAKLVKVGVDVGSDAFMAGLMAKRAGDINNAIANVNSFKPIDPLAPAADNIQTTYCQQNPGDTKCLTGGLDRTFDAMGDNVVTFGDGGTGTTYNNTNPFLDPSTPTANAVNPTNRNSIGSVGSVIPSAQQNGGLATVAPAASVTKGSAPAAGGGGGGGSGGGVGGGGGGGLPGAQQQGGVSAAIQGKTPSYGGGSGTLSMMGGYGINKSKSAAKDDGNPFGKLFNKDGNKSGVMNFREIASQKVGNKGDNLFDMISKRYSSVSGDKRLLEYELTK